MPSRRAGTSTARRAASSSTAELRGDFGECFARFCLRITDPDSWDAAPAEVLAGVEAILGVPVVSVLQRI
jgi:hypothetical protein